jgi:hypothetical protein
MDGWMFVLYTTCDFEDDFLCGYVADSWTRPSFADVGSAAATSGTNNGLEGN